MASKFRTAFKDTFRVLHTFALEVQGGFFLALAAIGVAGLIQEYSRFADAQGRLIPFLRISSVALFTLVSLGFGLHSFWKARKIQK